MEVLSEVVSVGAGFVTGWVFERRASSAARVQNAEFIRQISVLKTSISNFGGDRIAKLEQAPTGDLAGEVTQRAISTQDPEGRVDRGALIAHFVQRGFGRSDIEAAIGSLCSSGIARDEGRWLRIG